MTSSVSTPSQPNQVVTVRSTGAPSGQPRVRHS
jgi:hypothetical protein